MWPKLSSIILQWAGSLVKRHHNKTNLVLCHTDTIFWLFLIRWLAKRVSFHRDKSIIFYCSQFNCLSEWLKEIHGPRWCRPLPLLLQIIFCIWASESDQSACRERKQSRKVMFICRVLDRAMSTEPDSLHRTNYILLVLFKRKALGDRWSTAFSFSTAFCYLN